MHKKQSGGRAYFWKATILTGAKISAKMMSKDERRSRKWQKSECFLSTLLRATNSARFPRRRSAYICTFV
jgi:hypothetical protein